MPAPLLYDLTELQRHANRLYGLTAKDTLAVAQSLYEKHKLITYPRTDSRHLTGTWRPELGRFWRWWRRVTPTWWRRTRARVRWGRALSMTQKFPITTPSSRHRPGPGSEALTKDEAERI